jgi:hypothetical protein
MPLLEAEPKPATVSRPTPPPMVLATGSMPVMPVWYTSADRYHFRLFGSFKGPRDPRHPAHKQIAVYGCNMHYVPEFCGGLFLTAMNVNVHEYHGPGDGDMWGANSSAAQANRARGWDSLLSTDDVFNWDDAVLNIGSNSIDSAVSEWYHTRHRTMATIAATSLCSRVISWSGHQPGPRTNITYWDRENGYTHMILRWFTDLLGDRVVRMPLNMAEMYVPCSQLSGLRVEALHLLPFNPPSSTARYATTVVAHESSRPHVNPNSGYEVCTYTLITSSHAPRTHKSLVEVVSINNADEKVRSYGWPLMSIPNNWSPM